MVIAIDGPAGAGKSTVAKALARALGFTYLDSGAMYRCVALASLRETGLAGGAGSVGAGRAGAAGGAGSVGAGRAGAAGGAGSVGAGGALAALARSLRIELGDRVMLDGDDVTDAIRAPEVSQRASEVAADSGVRAALVAQQQRLLGSGDWVAEGRDIGTVVAPHAELKIFLTADPLERARRRAAELGLAVDAVLADQAGRDERDSTRADSPLMAASDATVLDTTGLTLEQVVDRIAQLARPGSDASHGPI